MLLYFLNAVLSENITFFGRALSYLKAFTSNSHEFLWERSILFTLFNSLCEVNVLLFHFLNAVLSEKITFCLKCLNIITSIHKKLTCISLKKSSLLQQYNSLYEVNGLLLHFLNAVVTEIITFYWNCLKLLTRIHQQLTYISLNGKQSVPTLQFTVQSEWSVASLSKCCSFRENHFPLKVA